MAPRPFVPLTDGAQAEVVFGFGAGELTCRLWFIRRSGVVDSSTLTSLIAGLSVLYAAEVMPFLSTSISLNAVRATDWTVPGGLTVNLPVTGISGAISGPCLSAISAARVILVGSQPPRNFKNYNFVPGIPESVVNLNTMDTTWSNHVRVAYADIIDAAAVWGAFPAWRWVCTSQAEDNTPRSEQFARRVDFVRVAKTIRQRRIRLLYT